MFRTLIRFCLCALLLSPGTPGLEAARAARGNPSRPVPLRPALGTGATVVYLPAVLRGAAAPSTWEQEYHVPYSVSSSGGPRLPEMAIFWFGQVDATRNYSDVRLAYNESGLYVNVATIDRRLWSDPAANPADLTRWDAVSLYLSLEGPGGAEPSTQSYRLRAQASQSSTGLRSAERGNGSGWASADVPFTAALSWRGDALNNSNDDEGWGVQFQIPFGSLGLAGPPPQGTRWALGVVVHDRDDQAGTPIPDTAWPSSLDPARPETWGRIAFGLPVYTPPGGAAHGSVTLRHAQNGVSVPDHAAGGHTTCGDGGINKWTQWGTRVWTAGEVENVVNVQNQADISDWPCFSKYFVTFPLAGHVPAGAGILLATLTLHLTGGSGDLDDPNEPAPPRSLIQVLTVNDAWDANTLNWNNAPLAWENVSRTEVEPHPTFPGWPGIAYTWDLSYAVARAVASGQSELRLALYSADGGRHSGKYFASSETGAFSAVSRPSLTITWGAP